MSDDEIKDIWTKAVRLFGRVPYHGYPNNLGKRIALMMVDELEAAGVTEADIDRVMGKRS